MDKSRDRIDKKWVKPSFGLLWKTEFEYKIPYSLQELVYRLKKVNGQSIENYHVWLEKKKASPNAIYFTLTTRNLRMNGTISGMAERLEDGTVIAKGYTGVDGFPLRFTIFGYPILAFIVGMLSTDIGVQFFIFLYVILVGMLYLYGRYLRDELAKKLAVLVDT